MAFEKTFRFRLQTRNNARDDGWRGGQAHSGFSLLHNCHPAPQQHGEIYTHLRITRPHLKTRLQNREMWGRQPCCFHLQNQSRAVLRTRWRRFMRGICRQITAGLVLSLPDWTKLPLLARGARFWEQQSSISCPAWVVYQCVGDFWGGEGSFLHEQTRQNFHRSWFNWVTASAGRFLIQWHWVTFPVHRFLQS